MDDELTPAAQDRTPANPGMAGTVKVTESPAGREPMSRVIVLPAICGEYPGATGGWSVWPSENVAESLVFSEGFGPALVTVTS